MVVKVGVTEPHIPSRLLATLPLALLFGFVGMVTTSLIGWSFDVDASPIERVGEDRWLLMISAGTGAAAGTILAWAFTNRRSVLLGAALLGTLPAVLKASAYFTAAY